MLPQFYWSNAMAVRLAVKRVYEPPSPEDGHRVLVDRLWPRGLRKEEARIDSWLRDLAPSDELRRWFGHDPARWPEFQRRYATELDGKRSLWEPLLAQARRGRITLLYAARDPDHNNAIALARYLEEHARTGSRRRR